jgi:outer membrane protein OmpA-like peptidoglycan-associated protein
LSYGSAVNKKALNKLAQLSGGEHYNIQRKYNITNVFKELPRVFKYYYEISFNPLNDTGKHKLTLKFNNLKGTMVENERTFFIGKNYGFNHEFNLPTYLLTEIPVRAKIISPPQAVARFKFDKHKLEMKYFEVLNKYIKFLIKNPEAEILLAGHTDSKGTAQYCRDLSVDRAEAVKKYIIESGIEEYRIHTRGYGKKHLKWDPDKKDFKSRENRRVEAVLYRD